MKKLAIIILSLLWLHSCSTDWNFEDTGLAQAHFDGNMYAYFQSNPYDWDSVRVMIEHAGLTELFSGSEKITFFGPTNISIRKWMNQNQIPSIRSLDKADCKKKLLDCVLKGNFLLDDIPEGDFINQEKLGGKDYIMESGITVWIYQYKSTYGGIQHTGPGTIYLRRNVSTEVASSDIQPTNGVVHALSYNYVFGSL